MAFWNGPVSSQERLDGTLDRPYDLPIIRLRPESHRKRKHDQRFDQLKKLDGGQREIMNFEGSLPDIPHRIVYSIRFSEILCPSTQMNPELEDFFNSRFC